MNRTAMIGATIGYHVPVVQLLFVVALRLVEVLTYRAVSQHQPVFLG